MAVTSLSSMVSEQIHSYRILRRRVHAVQVEQVIEIFEQWISDRRASHYVALCNVHMLMEAHRDAYFSEALDAADLILPDGMPLVWFARRRGFMIRRRVYGPDLFLDFCRLTAAQGYRHFLLGGHPGDPEAIATRLAQNCPGIQISGTCSPPFRKPTVGEHNEILARINDSHTDVLWVALGCPKQELWMYENRNRLDVPVVVGVGQAFDLFAGRVRQAPPWMRNNGLEWAFRLFSNPRRLWRRYLVCNTQFLCCLALDELRWVQDNSRENE
jgi:N-acetylglucosaminyldiphosphoundecaprenol N-acetyl-beta-D-mannosaminyltransferase